jgi:hypothetical protein
MRLPGFNAEASACRTAEDYRQISHAPGADHLVRPSHLYQAPGTHCAPGRHGCMDCVDCYGGTCTEYTVCGGHYY